MAVHLDVQTQFDDRSVRRTASDLTRNLQKQGDDAGKGWSEGFTRSTPKIESAMKKVADATGKVRVEQEKYNRVLKDGEQDVVKRVTAYERLAKAQRDHASVVRQASSDIVKANSGLEESSKRASVGLLNLGDTLGALGRAAGPVGIAALVPAIGALGGVAAAAAGSVALLPGAVGAAASAFGTLKLATMGLDDAFKNMQDPAKFAESLRALAPSAQQMMLSIQRMMPALTQLQKATQDALFADMGPQLTQFVNTMLPTVQRATTGIASAMNQAMTGAMNQLMTPDSMASIQNIVGNITKAFQNLAPAAAPLTQALTDLVEVGSGFLPQIAAGATEAARAFSQFISEAKSSGQLQQWLATGLDILRQMGPITLDVAKAFLSLAPIGERVMPLIADSMSLIAEILPPIAKVTAEISPLFASWEGGIRAATVAVGAMMPALTLVANTIGTVADGLAYLTGDAESRARADMLQARINAIGSASGPFGGAGDPMLGGGANASRERRGLPPVAGIPGGPFALPSGGGDWWKQGGNTAPLNLPKTSSPSAYVDELIRKGNEARSAAGGSGGGPSVPYAPLPGIAPGLQMDSTLYGAQTRVADTQTALEEKKARLNQLEADNTATADQIQNARNDVLKAEREHQEAVMRFGEAQQQAFKNQTQQMQGMTQQMGQLGAALDQDFGISKGLPGIVENITKFLGNLIAAPALMQLNAISNANPNQGSGLIGMLGSMGAFGSQYTPAAMQQSGYGGDGASVMGPTALQPGISSGAPYGLPAGTNTGGYGSSGAVFPGWVHQLEQMFGVKASTYSGHQESNRNEPGYAPNPGGLNRGIDWSGPVENMQQFANYLATIPSSLEQVIWQNPNTGSQTTIAGGSPVSGYYDAGTLADHQNHVHTRQSMALPVPGGGGAVPVSVVNGDAMMNPLSSAMGQWSADWNAIAQKESGGNWGINTGNGYSGGLQFSPDSWAAAGGTQYAPNAYQATPFQQAMTAENLLKMQGPGAWPNTFTPGSSGPGMYGAGMPTPGAGGGGGSGLMGMVGAQPQGMAYPSAGGAGFQGLGGLPMAALSTAASAVPGLGAAAQVGMQLANRVIAYGGQVAGIGISGLMETLSVGDNPMGSLGSSWFGKLAGGFAGARPALPNMAGKSANAPQGQGAQGEALAQQGGNTANINITNNGATPDQNGKDVAAHTAAMWAPAGRQ